LCNEAISFEDVASLPFHVNLEVDVRKEAEVSQVDGGRCTGAGLGLYRRGFPAVAGHDLPSLPHSLSLVHFFPLSPSAAAPA
jgi:hypothetical protein